VRPSTLLEERGNFPCFILNTHRKRYLPPSRSFSVGCNCLPSRLPSDLFFSVLLPFSIFFPPPPPPPSSGPIPSFGLAPTANLLFFLSLPERRCGLTFPLSADVVTFRGIFQHRQSLSRRVRFFFFPSQFLVLLYVFFFALSSALPVLIRFFSPRRLSWLLLKSCLYRAFR